MCQHGETEIVRLLRPNTYSGRTEVEVDRCIALIVQQLNDIGIRTLNSCCGHGKGPGSIIVEAP